MTHPDFILLGAPKAGTTAMYHYLGQHPDVFFPDVKEPGFFAFEGQDLSFRDHEGNPASLCEYTVTDADAYRALYADASPDAVTGDASTLYLHSEHAARTIPKYRPDAKLIAILRHPVDRMYASYMHCVRDGREPLDSFREAIAAEDRRIRDNWGFLWRHTTQSYYSDAVARYQDAVGADQLRVYLFEDFKASPADLAQKIFAFVGCDPSFAPDTSLRHNASGVPASRALEDALRNPHPAKRILKALLPASVRRSIKTHLRNRNLNKPTLDPAVRAEMTEWFVDDIRRLADLIDRDLSHWLP